MTAHPILYALAASLAVTLFIALLTDRSTAVRLPRGDWRCAASHPDWRAGQRGDGTTEPVLIEVCDEWVRR